MRVEVKRLTPLQSRAAAIALALCTLAVAYFVLLHWWFVAPLMQVDGQIHDLERLHARYAAAIAQQPLLERRVATLQRGGAGVGAFLAASDPSTASADLIQRATDVVAAHANEGGGCSMPSKMPIEEDNANQRFRKVSVSISLDCGIQPLAAVLHEFNSGQPYLFVDNLSIARTQGARLQAQLSLSGYLRPTKSAGAGAATGSDAASP